MQEHLHTNTHALPTFFLPKDDSGLDIGRNFGVDCDELFRRVEYECWAPWLRFESKHFVAHQQLFPEGQFRLYDEHDNPYATLSCTRIEWDAVVRHLPSWDAIAGPSFTFSES